MAKPDRIRDPMLAWWIGLVIIVAAVGYSAYRFACLECGPGGFLEFMVLGIVPIVYLVLMYLTLQSQADSERQ